MALNDHLRKGHKIGIEVQEINLKLKCDQCPSDTDTTDPTEKLLGRHQQAVHGEKRRHCDDCGRDFTIDGQRY